MTHKTICEIHL